VVTLSSSNTNVARTPSSVTIAAELPARRLGEHQRRTCIKTVSISGVTVRNEIGLAHRDACALPPLALASLTLSPSSVIGGLEPPQAR